jgi:SAM-dependent methyltransferase
LTTQQYWDDQWSTVTVPATIDTGIRPAKLLDILFRKFLPVSRDKRFLEIGCAPGKWMVYFSRAFKYHIYGIEYSESGYKKTVENMAGCGIDDAMVVKGDFFNTDLPDPMDIVFTYGVLEHFDDTRSAVARNAAFLKNGGITVTILPNLNWFYGTLQGIVDLSVLKGHKRISAETLRPIMSELGFKPLYCGYAGVFHLGLVNWKKSPLLIRRIINTINRIILKMGDSLGVTWETPWFSPYILYIGTKTAAAGEE